MKKKFCGKKINLFFVDLKILFENNKKFYDLENNSIKSLIIKLKIKIKEKYFFLNKFFIGCGEYFSFIFNNSLFFVFFLFKIKKKKKNHYFYLEEMIINNLVLKDLKNYQK
jgi:hypothetical protein